MKNLSKAFNNHSDIVDKKKNYSRFKQGAKY